MDLSGMDENGLCPITLSPPLCLVFRTETAHAAFLLNVSKMLCFVLLIKDVWNSGGKFRLILS